MKELKAVEILEDLKRVHSTLSKNIGLKTSTELSIRQALAELAELTQEKSCERCEHSKDIAAHLNIVICTYDDDDMPSENGTTSLKVGKEFYCKYYTPKKA